MAVKSSPCARMSDDEAVASPEAACQPVLRIMGATQCQSPKSLGRRDLPIDQNIRDRGQALMSPTTDNRSNYQNLSIGECCQITTNVGRDRSAFTVAATVRGPGPSPGSPSSLLPVPDRRRRGLPRHQMCDGGPAGARHRHDLCRHWWSPASSPQSLPRRPTVKPEAASARS